MSEEMEVACLLCLSDDKLSPETFGVVCQMTNRSQRRFEPFVRGQIARRDVFGMSDPSTSRKMTILEYLYSGVFAGKGIFMDRHASLAMTGVRSLDCHADARNDGCEVTGLPRFARNDGCEVTGLSRGRSQGRVGGHWIATLRSQGRVGGHWIATLTLAMMGLVHEFTKVFSRARG